MASDSWISKEPCPTCGGPVEVWYAFDDYGPSGGASCATDSKHVIPYEVAYPEVEEKKMVEGFNIHVEADIYLPLDQIWPDGDTPENPTAEDVRDLILDLYGNRSDFLREWSLLDDLGVDVDSVEVWK